MTFGQMNRAVRWFFLALAVLSDAGDAWSQRRMPSDIELRKLMEETPIEFSIGKLRYQVPKNYLVRMTSWVGGPQESASLKVKYPGLAPFSEKTKACFLRQETCRTIQFTISSELSTSSDQIFDAIEARNSRHSVRRDSSDGYDIVHIGPEDARTRYYSKQLPDRKFYFWCSVGGCQVFTRIRSGAVIVYRFPEKEIASAESVDTALRDLVDSFVVGKMQ